LVIDIYGIVRAGRPKEYAMTEEDASQQLLERCNEVLRRLAALARPKGSDWLDLDLGMGQFKAMLVLTEQERQTIGGLGRALGIAEPSASLLVDKLVSRGLAVREADPDDRRRTQVAPTDEGRLLMSRLRRTREDQIAAWLGALEEDELRSLLVGLEALVRVMESGRRPE
jgi:DNA-binding MarR family transcriptional regulator